LSINIIGSLWFSECSTLRNLKLIEKYGIKGSIIRSPFMYLVLLSMFLSYWFIPLGILWTILAIILSLGIIMISILPEAEIEMTIPKIGSEEFSKSVGKRKKNSILGLLLLIAWVESWVIT